MLPRIEASPNSPAGTVIILHGLGASGEDFAPVVDWLGRDDLRFILPHAPDLPVTVNGGYVMPAWYDIRALSGPEREDGEGLRRSAAQILEIVANEVERGVPTERIVLVGFSQGGAVVLDLLTRAPVRFAGGMILSSYLVEPASLDDRLHPANAETPVWFAHGERDDVVPMARGRAAFEALRERGRPVAWDAYRMAHEVCESELAAVQDRLARWLPAV